MRERTTHTNEGHHTVKIIKAQKEFALISTRKRNHKFSFLMINGDGDGDSDGDGEEDDSDDDGEEDGEEDGMDKNK